MAFFSIKDFATELAVKVHSFIINTDEHIPAKILVDSAGDEIDVATETTLAAINTKVQDTTPIAVSGLQLNPFRPVDGEAVAFSDTSAESSELAAGRVRIVAIDADARVVVGESPITATAASMLIYQDQPEYLLVGEGEVIAVIRAGSDNGTLELATELDIPAV